MKNRYGQDGMTYNIKMDTNNGRIEFEGKAMTHDELPDNNAGPKFSLDRETMNKLF